MDSLLWVANWVLPLIYLALAIDYGAAFILRNRTHARNVWIVPAVGFHALFLVLWGVKFGGPPLASSYEVLSVIALSAALIYGAVELATRDRRAGVFVFLLVFVLQYASSAFLGGALAGLGASTINVQHGWDRLHALPASLAYTALAFAAVYACLYLVGQRDFKQHHFGLLFDRLPPLELLGKMSWYALAGGFALMTIAMVTGALLFGRADGGVQAEPMTHKVAAKIIIGSIAWVVCAVAVAGKYLGKWTAPRVSRIAVAGFLIIVALFVTSAILS